MRDPRPNEYLTKPEIIERLGKEKQVEKWIENIKKQSINSSALRDAAQDFYCHLLELPTEKLERLWETGQIDFYACRILSNWVNSKSSRYYYIYIKPSIHEDLSGWGLTERTYNNPMTEDYYDHYD